ncbi:uncharacterized protein LOC119568609 [Penaeus monodon]|uniref:uncharacterized protein LOC119568609 n=1 Tax=Penaeus monodon TaxID=6687 RepID=UPI0018A7AC8E|nr:uncharacterized protein LOC119568609 [Penaeus monodon]
MPSTLGTPASSTTTWTLLRRLPGSSHPQGRPETVTLKTVAPTPLTYKLCCCCTRGSHPDQYHAQDEIGQYSFGYAGGPSSRAESRDIFGIVRGSYNYVDSEGKVQTQHYVADALGFRVSGTNLPVAPDAPEAAPLAALPGPVPKPSRTPLRYPPLRPPPEGLRRSRRRAAAAPDSRKKRSVVSAFTPYTALYSPLRFSYGFSAPAFPSLYSGAALPTFGSYAAHPAAVTYTAAAPAAVTYTAAAPAALKDAELLRIVHNPGHGTSYRVQ